MIFDWLLNVGKAAPIRIGAKAITPSGSTLHMGFRPILPYGVILGTASALGSTPHLTCAASQVYFKTSICYF
ncbi:hypothetical protein [Portibacter marinus]|uniref:hypothetical protein n=1 Tax=Portibacter marinus TaxID=2898660 RepID=UPI001F46DBFF|nr:hypothetical protein [Portibacter marinus]